MEEPSGETTQNGAIKILRARGIEYTEAYYPHGRPATATGHAAFQTGAYAGGGDGKHGHGIINNDWLNDAGTMVASDGKVSTPADKNTLSLPGSPRSARDDASTPSTSTLNASHQKSSAQADNNTHNSSIPRGAILTPTGTDPKRIASPDTIMCTGLAAAFMAGSTRSTRDENESPSAIGSSRDKNAVIALSHKSRAAIPLAGVEGKAIWFDSKLGMFTSSTAYYPSLPPVVTEFNKTLKLSPTMPLNWKQLKKDAAYNFAYCGDYRATTYGKAAINTSLTLADFNPKDPYDIWCYTPAGVAALFDLAEKTLENALTAEGKENVLLFISVSSADLVGHTFGENKEKFDILYHIDAQLGSFITKLENRYSENTTLTWLLTADHGILPFPELLTSTDPKNGNKAFMPQGVIPEARRIDSDALVTKLNEKLKRELALTGNLVAYFEVPSLYFDKKIEASLLPAQRDRAIEIVKTTLLSSEGIKYVWTPSDLLNKEFDKTYPESSPEYWMKMQYYTGRSGDMIVLVKPWIYLTQTTIYGLTGTSHVDPYWYNVRVPLLIASNAPGSTTATITDPVSMLSVAPTIAATLNLPPLAAAVTTRLPVFPLLASTTAPRIATATSSTQARNSAVPPLSKSGA